MFRGLELCGVQFLKVFSGFEAQFSLFFHSLMSVLPIPALTVGFILDSEPSEVPSLPISLPDQSAASGHPYVWATGPTCYSEVLRLAGSGASGTSSPVVSVARTPFMNSRLELSCIFRDL